MFAINIDENGRILSATSPQYAPDWYVRVESLPPGDISDYIYTMTGYVYAPVNSDPCAETNIEEDKIFNIEGETYRAKMPIAHGEYITSRNAERIAVEDYLNTLQTQEVT